MPGVLEELQEVAVSRMQSDPYYARVSLLREQLHDIRAQIRTALGKIGIVGIVVTPQADCNKPNAPGPILDGLNLVIDITELVIVNRGANGSRQPASEVAEHTAWLLHSPNHPGRNDKPIMALRSINLVPDPTYLIYRVTMQTSVALAGIVAPSTNP